MSIESEFIVFSADRLEKLLVKIETCMAKLTPEQVWMRHSENENAVGNLMLHLAGNVRQWIVSGVGGAADTRERDKEFAARDTVPTPAELTARLRSTVGDAVCVIRSVADGALLDRIAVQGYDVTKMAAILTVLEHFSGHTFQIIFATKLMTSQDLRLTILPAASTRTSR